MKKLSSSPYLLWMILFTIVPMVLVLYYSLTVDGNFSFSNFSRVFEPVYLKVLTRSFVLAFQATVLCLLFGYPMAMILSKMSLRRRTFAVMMFVLPMWMNFLLRTYAWMTILGKNGILNGLLGFFGMPSRNFLFTEAAVLLGMVYNFLPFMVLPIYTVLTKMDRSLIEAAEDLGANRRKVFTKVILPLSAPGVVSGISMVFMPSVTTFVIPTLLYGGQYMLVGNLIEKQFLETRDIGFGSAVSLILMTVILVSMTVMNRASGGNKEVSTW